MSNKMKHTEIGLLPEDWDVMKISQISCIRTGGKNTQDKIENGLYPFIVRSQTIERINSYSFDGEAILTAGDGVGVGKVFHYLNEKFDYHQRVYSISNFEQGVSGFYFFKYFQNNFYNRIMQMTAKSSVDSVRMETIADMQIPIPPLPEQEAIAAALSDADAWIESLEQLIAKKRLIKQGVMQELLRPKEDWAVKKLGELGEVKMCKRIFQYQTSEYGDIPFFKIGTFGKEPDAFISRNHFEEFKSRFSYPLKGEILISAAGTIGRTVVYDGEESYFQDSNIVWINNQEKIVSNELLKYILEVVKYNTEGGTIQRLYNSILKNTTFYCPPFSEQTLIVTIISDINAELEALESQLIKARQVKQGMMQELLTGRTRLV